MSNDNILKPIVDGLYDGFATLFDMYGNLVYRLVEGKKYVDEDKPCEEIEIENLIKYEYIPTEEFEVNKDNNIIKYEFAEGDKEGISAYIGKGIMGDKFKLDILDGSVLIGGMTGGGKSNILNVIITSIMLTYTKNEVCFIGCDLAMADVYYFRKFKHFIGMSTTHKEFLEQINWLETKFKDRMKILNDTNCRNARSYNCKHDKKMSYIIFVIDELVILAANNDCKKRLHDVMCVGRKCGCYFIVCGQDATKDTIGRCKMNCPQIIGLQTFDETDSNTIIGKNQNLQDINVKGRCKIKNADGITEVQSYFIEEDEIEARLKHLEK